MKYFLAFDLGASSGRAILGTLQEGRVEITEIHRFENGGIDVNGKLHWNILGLYAELKTGLKKALAKGVPLSGIAVDTWGVDFALIDSAGTFAGLPYHYRDSRTNDILPYAFSRVPREALYARTGIQFMTLNTAFQLLSMVRDEAPVLQVAEKLLMMPNALTYLLSGDVSAEYSVATTTQLYDAAAHDWAWDVIDAFGIPRKLFPDITPSCTAVGSLRPALCEELNCDPVPVVLVGSHDTASAVAAVPATAGTDWAYLSSGTWSLLGVELNDALMTPAALAGNFTNEGGVGGTIRFLKNIMGLWLIQESRAEWARQGTEYSYAELSRLAAAAEPFRSFVDPDDPRFIAPGNMPERLAAFCRETGQPEPRTPGEVTRCALESLALRYRQVLDEIESITGRCVKVLHLVGGGSQDELLNQFTADATERRVVTGPVEATAIGNIVCQAMAVGAIPDLAAARAVVKQSFSTGEYTPRAGGGWKQALQRYTAVLS